MPGNFPIAGLVVVFAQAACLVGRDKVDDPHVAEVLAAIFKRAASEPKSIPDGQLLKAPEIVVREEIGLTKQNYFFSRWSVVKVPPEALKGLSGWHLRPAEAIQQEADTAGALKYFVVVESVTMERDKAVVKWGTDLAIPKRDDGRAVFKVCCSLATDHYRKRGDTWVFSERSCQIVF